jgi:hypothetical protein
MINVRFARLYIQQILAEGSKVLGIDLEIYTEIEIIAQINAYKIGVNKV